MKTFILLFLVIFFNSKITIGKIISAPELTPDSVQSTIDQAKEGDIVQVPAGTATWTKGVIITKSITLQGAGIGVTTINMEYPNSTDRYSSVIGVERLNNWRITGMTIRQDTTKFSRMCINAMRTTGFRIDHMRFENISIKGIYIGDQSGVSPTGLIDHCFFEAPFNLSAQAVTLHGNDTARPPAHNANANWAIANEFGTSNAVFVEDCVFDFSYQNDAGIELYTGANVVVRYNTFRNCGLGVHGRDSSVRSGCLHEFYHNTMTADIGNKKVNLAQIRGGTGVWWNNTMTATGRGATNINQILLSSYRSTYNLVFSKIGESWNLDGSSPTDGNEPSLNGTGTHTGSDGLSTLIDDSKSWQTDAWSHGGVEGTIHRPHYIWNRTDGSGGFVTGNSSTSVSVTLSGGTRNNWKTGDIYVITNGYPGLDQVGRIGPTKFFANYSTQTLSPLYQWNNTFNGSTTNAFPFVVQFTDGPYSDVVPRADSYIIEGREFFNDTIKPDYTPYTYPHPLAVSESIDQNLVLQPDNLKVSASAL